MHLRKINTAVLCLLMTPFLAAAQSRKLHAVLAPVSETGLYRIDMSAALVAGLEPDLNNLRIKNSKGTAIPYTIFENEVSDSSERLLSLRILKNQVIDSNRTEVIFSEPRKRFVLSSLEVFMRNSTASRPAMLSGSNDGVNWYIINDKAELKAGGSVDASGASVCSLEFPESKFRFYRFLIYNGQTDPLKVEQIKTREAGGRTAGVLLPNADLLQRRRDSSDGSSYIFFENPKRYHISALKFSVTSTRLYDRTVRVFTVGNTPQEKKFLAPLMHINAVISTINFPVHNEAEFAIAVGNGDNPPLSMEKVASFYPARYAVAELHADERYSLVNAAANAPAPMYELSRFRDTLSRVTRYASVKNISISESAPAGVKERSGRLFFWICLGAAVAVLFIIAVRMLNAVKSKA